MHHLTGVDLLLLSHDSAGAVRDVEKVEEVEAR